VAVKVLVTGGAGFIGSTVALALRDNGDQPVLLDDLSAGDVDFLRSFPHYVGDIADAELIACILREHPDIAVAVHCAARTVVAESVERPLEYYATNVGKTVQLFDALMANGCIRVVFSSTAAVYGTTDAQLITEDTPARPETPYARTKLIVEDVLTDACATTPLTAVSLRYFNPLGCDPQLRSGPVHPPSALAIQALIEAAAQGHPFRINGTDWHTPDGTPLRDFVHAWDVALAHVAVVQNWPVTGRHEIVNIGSGVGTTVRQLADVFNELVERPVAIEYGARRAGDIVGGYTSTERARQLFGWEPTRTVEDAVTDALRWAEHRAGTCVPPRR
jgi:UDP-glucose 4-epimerase